MTHRTCSRCGESKSLHEFSGRKRQCRPCVTVAAREYRARKKSEPALDKVCTVCGERKPGSEFSTGRSACKPCRCLQMAAWYAANQPRLIVGIRERRSHNRARVRENDMARYYRNRDKRIALVVDSEHRRRAVKQGNASDRGITVLRIRHDQGDCCVYCGCEMFFGRLDGRTVRRDKATIDHVVPISRGGGHVWSNVVLACWACNSSKRDLLLAEWSGRP